tara:strand:+ start:411 stop:1664 length:1254 start_codon:yes stop_codon:yes gene_type:complete
MTQQRAKATEIVFDKLAEEFEDLLVISDNIESHSTDAVAGERSNYTEWQTMPYINKTEDGLDQTANFKGSVQRVVPTTVNTFKSVPFLFTGTEMNDPDTLARLTSSATNALASEIENNAIDLACRQGTLVVPVLNPLTGFGDVALCDSIMNEQEVPTADRKLALNSRDYNLMAGNLAARQLDSSITSEAYRKASLGDVSGFDTYKMQSSYSLTAAAGTTVTMNGASQYYTPKSEDASGPVDSRYQTISITVGGGTVAVGDAFTLPLVYSLGHQSKRNSGQLKTFRIHEIVTGAGGTGTVKISPPIISAEGATAGEEQYKNVSATPADSAELTFLNTANKQVNPFWAKNAIQLLPGKLPMPTGTGAEFRSYTTKNGITIAMSNQWDNNARGTTVRFDVFYGLAMLQPEMAGILIGDQL